MTPQPRFIRSGEKLSDTLELFLTHQIHYAPVIAPDKEILGMLSDVALVKASLRKYMKDDASDSVYAHKDLLETACTVRDSSSLEEVVRAMLKAPQRRVLVVDMSGQLVGIISPRDILKVLAGKNEAMNGMRDELRELEEKARQLEQEVYDIQQLVGVYREIFEASPLIMHSVDGNGNIAMANRKAHEALGYAPGELLGKSIYNLYPPAVHEQARAGLELIKQTGSHKATMTSMVRKDGGVLHVDLVSSSLKTSSNRFLGTITAARPVQESKALLDSLAQLFDDPKGPGPVISDDKPQALPTPLHPNPTVAALRPAAGMKSGT